jgi:hypothetical protein
MNKIGFYVSLAVAADGAKDISAPRHARNMHMDTGNKPRLALAAILIALLLNGCAVGTGDRVNGDAWRYGFRYAGPDYPDTGR